MGLDDLAVPALAFGFVLSVLSNLALAGVLVFVCFQKVETGEKPRLELRPRKKAKERVRVVANSDEAVWKREQEENMRPSV